MSSLTIVSPQPFQATKLKSVTRRHQYKCHYPGCSSMFSRRSDLNRHDRTHTQLRPHICKWPGCNKAFNQKGQLNTHKNTHTGEKPHRCEVCAKTFSDPASRTRHRKEAHGNQVDNQCPMCNSKIKRLRSFHRHLRDKHDIHWSNDIRTLGLSSAFPEDTGPGSIECRSQCQGGIQNPPHLKQAPVYRFNPSRSLYSSTWWLDQPISMAPATPANLLFQQPALSVPDSLSTTSSLLVPPELPTLRGFSSVQSYISSVGPTGTYLPLTLPTELEDGVMHDLRQCNPLYPARQLQVGKFPAWSVKISEDDNMPINPALLSLVHESPRLEEVNYPVA